MTLGRQLVLALAALVALATHPASLGADVPGRVLIVASSDTTALLEEGLVRVRGEIAPMIAAVVDGMYVSLYSTLLGIATNLWLKINLRLLGHAYG